MKEVKVVKTQRYDETLKAAHAHINGTMADQTQGHQSRSITCCINQLQPFFQTLRTTGCDGVGSDTQTEGA